MSDTAYVSNLPGCDIHDRKHPAKYDAAVLVDGSRRWVFVCEEAFRARDGHLGTGRGQLLLVDEPSKTDDEISSELQSAIESGNFDLAEDLIGDRDLMEFL